MNSSSITDWIYDNQNQMTINIVQQAVSLFFGVLIFIRTYDFQSLLSSVRQRRIQAKKEKEKRQLEKFRRLLELSKNGEVDIKAVLSEGSSIDEEKTEAVMKVARKKKRVEMSV